MSNSIMRKVLVYQGEEYELKALDAMADAVLNYRPKPKSKAAKKRARKAKKKAKGCEVYCKRACS